MASLFFIPFFFLFLHLLLIIATTPDLCHDESRPEGPAAAGAALFVFGDSFFDAGNNNYINTSALDQANFWPYGETHFKFPTGRFSDGRLISDFIAEYAQLPLIPPYLQPAGIHHWKHGVNFASAGAGALVETFQGSVINLKTQLNYFNKVENQLKQELSSDKAGLTFKRAVYMFSIGSNDYMSPFLTNSTILNSYTKAEYVGMVIGNLSTVIKEIHGKGGRRFGFINLPPLGCLPGMRIMIDPKANGSCLRQEASSMAKLHNQALSELLLKLENQLKGFKYSLYDFNSNLRRKMRHPTKYGFREGEVACCGTGRYRGVFSCGGKRIVKEFELCEDPSKHVFWDSYHLTERAYKQAAQHTWSGHSLSPYSLKDLFQGH